MWTFHRIISVCATPLIGETVSKHLYFWSSLCSKTEGSDQIFVSKFLNFSRHVLVTINLRLSFSLPAAEEQAENLSRSNQTVCCLWTTLKQDKMLGTKIKNIYICCVMLGRILIILKSCACTHLHQRLQQTAKKHRKTWIRIFPQHTFI